MKFKEAKNWELKNDSLIGLLFFIQRIQELAYHKSHFLEKNITISTWELLNEYKEILENIRDHNTSQHYTKEIKIIYNEIVENIHNDSIIKKLLGDKVDKYINEIRINEKEIDYTINSIDLVRLKIHPQKYLNLFKDNIVEILNAPKKKYIIKQYCDNFYKFLLYVGYQKGSISHLINITYFNEKSTKTIKNNNDIFLFLDYFDLQPNIFEVYFAASPLYLEQEEECNQFGIEIIQTKKAEYKQSLEKNFFKNKKGMKVYLKCINIKAMDYLHAVKLASQKLSTLGNLTKVFFHTNKQWISDDCLVYYHKNKDVIRTNVQNNFMINNFDTMDTTKEILKPFLKSFSLKNDSFKRFKRAIDLHSLSIQSKETSNQILNLWICFESLLIVEKGKTHISIIEEALILISTNNLLLNTAINLLELILEWDTEKYREIINELPKDVAENELNSLIVLITLKEYEKIATKLLKEFDEQPLLRFKFFELIKKFQDKKEIIKLIETNKITVSNNIRRVYRIRNKIVHQGYLAKYDDFIVESAHYYIDELLETLILKRVYHGGFDSIQNFLIEESLIKEEYASIINKIEIDNLNVEKAIRLVKGPDN